MRSQKCDHKKCDRKMRSQKPHKMRSQKCDRKNAIAKTTSHKMYSQKCIHKNVFTNGLFKNVITNIVTIL